MILPERRHYLSQLNRTREFADKLPTEIVGGGVLGWYGPGRWGPISNTKQVIRGQIGMGRDRFLKIKRPGLSESFRS
jgi:hypothetical protein